MLKRAFEASFALTTESGKKDIKTRGDVSYEESRTEIEVKNVAADEVRYIPGMKSTTFSLTVQASTDPEDTTNFDAYETLKEYYEAGEVFELTFESPEDSNARRTSLSLNGMTTTLSTV